VFEAVAEHLETNPFNFIPTSKAIVGLLEERDFDVASDLQTRG